MSLTGLRSQRFFDDKNRAFWLLQSLGWGGYFVLRALGGLANAMGLVFVLPALLATATGYSLTLLMAVVYRRMIRAKPLWLWSVSIFTLVVASAAFSVIEVWAHATFYEPGWRPKGVEFLGAILLDLSVLGAWSALYFGINYYLLLSHQSERMLKLENQASSAQLAMLRYQLNPHFLFNTLNSISTLVLLKQTERANVMLSRLSSFLRYTLIGEPTAQVTLAQEVESLKLYLEIEKMRFEDRLRPRFEIEPRAEAGRLPSLLLQPLVENSVKYAVTPQEEGAEILVEARVSVDRLIITISDTGPGAAATVAPAGGGTLAVAAALTDAMEQSISSTGVGLANTRDRLAQAYGPDHRFEMKNNASGGTDVVIEIPYHIQTPKDPNL
jgi:two-component system, LytTR family, sensor kinase